MLEWCKFAFKTLADSEQTLDGVHGGASAQVRKSATADTKARNWQRRRITSRLFSVSFDKAEKDGAQSKLFKR